ASLVRILGILGTGFLRPLLLAFAIATPLAWFGCHAYLQNFAFHTTLSWWVFAASGLLMISIALATIGVHTLKAALSNPVDSLRTE
ncbi:MAG TPA: hypothetical protein VN824_03755, partial [Puia sp.]|nr:hypothetical protein [Puia sp.]